MRTLVVSIVCGLGMLLTASAASVTWSANNLKGPDGGVLSGAVAYLFVGTQDADALKSAIEGGTFTGEGALYSKATTGTGGLAQANLGSWSNESVTYYSVWFDGPTIAGSGNYLISSDVTLNFVNSNLTLLFQQSSGNGRLPDTWSPVPEPTSMALLALGVASVGLRRRFRK